MQRRIVKAIRRKKEAPEYVYNLRIKDNHNYFANNILVHNCDDPNSASDSTSEIQRERKIEWWNQVWSTRLNDKKNDCRIVVQQRVNERDVSGYIIGHDDLNEWTKLILPMEYEHKRKSRTIILPTTCGKIWEDPRTKEGQLLWPERIGDKELKSLKQSLGSEYTIAGQLQQRPSPESGGIIKKAWFKLWKYASPPEIAFVVQSWDTALGASEMSAYSACTTWGVFYDQHRVENVILLSMWRDRIGYPELREMAKRLYFDYRDTGKTRHPSFTGKNIDLCLVESKATGDPLIRDLYLAGIRATPFNPDKFGDKISRVRLITPLLEGGMVWLPTRAPDHNEPLPYADIFRESAGTFPNAESRDLVDTMTQALLKLKQGNFLVLPRDDYQGEQQKPRVGVGFV